jgi:hypothetical protein
MFHVEILRVKQMTDREDRVKKLQHDNLSQYAQMGMAALLPGMVHAVELMQAQIDEFKAQLAAMQNGGMKPTTKHHVSPEGRARIAEAQKRRWAKAKKKTITRAAWKAEKQPAAQKAAVA